MPQALQQATLGGGCFWCLDAAYRQIAGITASVCGYSGGRRPDPSYEQVLTGLTGHAEVVQLTFDPATISFADVLDIFFTIHDPTQPDRQGHDVGPQYRSVIFYDSPNQHKTAEAKLAEIAPLWPAPIVTQLAALETFYPAEPEHQDYFRRHPERAYCQIVINPKLAKLRERFAARLRADL